MKEFNKKLEKYLDSLISLGGRSPSIFMGKETAKIIYLTNYSDILKEKEDNLLIDLLLYEGEKKNILDELKIIESNINTKELEIDKINKEKESVKKKWNLEKDLEKLTKKKEKNLKRVNEIEKNKKIFSHIDKESKK